MRIYELVDAIPAGAPYVYICHAPDGDCRVLHPDGSVHDAPPAQEGALRFTEMCSQAIGKLFDAHWRGANATEVAAHSWPRLRSSAEVSPEEKRALGQMLLGREDVGDVSQVLSGGIVPENGNG